MDDNKFLAKFLGVNYSIGDFTIRVDRKDKNSNELFFVSVKEYNNILDFTDTRFDSILLTYIEGFENWFLDIAELKKLVNILYQNRHAKKHTDVDFYKNSLKHRIAANDKSPTKYDDHFSGRNVIDKFKNKTNEEIRAELKATAFPYIVIFENWIGDFNIATGIRCANAFNAKKVYYYGNKDLNKKACMGSYNYTDVEFIESKDQLIELKKDYHFVAVDNVGDAKSIDNYTWKKNTAIVFGEEGVGLTQGMIDFCDDLVYIEMYGSIRSLNCGVASGIIMQNMVSYFRFNNIK